MNNNATDHDHSESTHSAKCDLCDYVATTHTHDDDSAVMDLSDNLALHNKEVHSTETNPADITNAIKSKMKTV